MTRRDNIDLARKFLSRIGKRADPDEIAALFSSDVEFEIGGDVGALPWIGKKTGCSAVSDFIRDSRRLIEQVHFDVQDVLASDERAVIVGELTTRIIATERMIESAFAIILTSQEGKITRFQMLEDSFAVSRAARQQ